MNKLIGYTLMASPIIFVFSFGIYTSGWAEALKVFGVVVGFLSVSSGLYYAGNRIVTRNE